MSEEQDVPEVTGRRQEGATSSPQLAPSDFHGPTEEAVLARVASICRTYQDAGFGDAHFPLLVHLLTAKDSGLKVEDMPGVWACVAPVRNGRREDQIDFEARRLNGEGLNVFSRRPGRGKDS